MKNTTSKIVQSLKIITLAIALSFGLSYVYAWTAPTAPPPGGNTSAPLNTGETTQTRVGDLYLFGNSTTGGTLSIKSPVYDPNNTLSLGARDVTSLGPAPLYINYGDAAGDVQIGGQGETKTLTVTGNINATGNVCGGGGGCLRTPMYEVINVASGTTYTRSHVGLVEIEFHGGVHQSGLANIGWYFYVNGAIVSATNFTVNYQVSQTPSFSYFLQANGNFTVREDWIGSMLFGQIVIKKY